MVPNGKALKESISCEKDLLQNSSPSEKCPIILLGYLIGTSKAVHGLLLIFKINHIRNDVICNQLVIILTCNLREKAQMWPPAHSLNIHKRSIPALLVYNMLSVVPFGHAYMETVIKKRV